MWPRLIIYFFITYFQVEHERILFEYNITKIKFDDSFYDDAVHYWEQIPATVDGMLEGFGFFSEIDLEGSKKFLQQILRFKNGPGKTRALDCGSGIGRITKNVLLPIFDNVDMVEQNPAFLEKASTFIGPVHKEKLGTLYPVGLQYFTPDENKYDLIWCQWVLCHLRDDHLIEFLKRSIKALKPNGVIIVKENVLTTRVVIHKDDSSVTRPITILKRFFEKASLKVIQETEQTPMPKGFIPVRMFALKPQEQEHSTIENSIVSGIVS